MNDFRRSLVEQAFRKLDNNGNGFIEFDDIKDIYNARKHPDVIQGKRTEQQVLNDFIETFEIHHAIRTRDGRDSRISLEEFLEYYDNVSISIDTDDYFTLMINNSWNIKGDAYTY